MSAGEVSQEDITPSKGPDSPHKHREGKSGYGVDEPRTIILLVISGVLSVATGVLISFYEKHPDVDISRLSLLGGAVVGFLILVFASLLYWSHSERKVRELEKVVASIPWGGSEVALDLGCGRGLGVVTAARRVGTGFAVGLDVWNPSDVLGNDPRSVKANAAAQGVAEKVSAVKGNLTSLPFIDSSVDVVISACAIHRFHGTQERGTLFQEIWRVLKDGGRVGILEDGNGSEYTRRLKELGMSDVTMKALRWSSFPPFHVIMARKPFQG